MRTVTLQEDEAREIETLLDGLLISGVINDGAARRRIRRVSMKLHWAAAKDMDQCKADS